MILLTLLSGCATIDHIEDIERAALAKIGDEFLDTGVYLTCVTPSAGTLGRRFKTEEEMKMWREFCNMDAGGVLP